MPDRTIDDATQLSAGTVTQTQMRARWTIHASARPADDIESEPSTWFVEGDDYDAVMAQVESDLPSGWRLVDVTVHDNDRSGRPVT